MPALPLSSTCHPSRLLGLALAGEGCAALISALFTARVNRRWGEPRSMVWGLGLEAVGALVLAGSALGGGVMLFVLAQLLFGLSLPLVNISLVTLRQRLAPRSMLGRVNSIARVCIMSALPLGSLLAGLVAQGLRTSTTLWVLAVGLVAVWTLLARPMLRCSTKATSAG